jgi:cyclic beta-1,2-glucan synthetase
MMALLLFGWFVLPGSGLVWMALALSPYILTILFNLLSNLGSKEKDEPPDAMSQPSKNTILRIFFEVVFLPHEALLDIDAIVTTLVRLFVIRKRLLRWTASAHVVSVFSKDLKLDLVWREMTVGPFFALAVALSLLFWRRDQLIIAAPLLLSWMLLPRHRGPHQPPGTPHNRAIKSIPGTFSALTGPLHLAVFRTLHRA